MQEVCENVCGWAQEVFLVDSFSVDDTVSIALANGVTVVQRKFRGFGDQWSFAATRLPITSPWTMKLDPDERIPEALKAQIAELLAVSEANAIVVQRRLHFLGKMLPARTQEVRIWRTGRAEFRLTTVNERAIVDGEHPVLSAPLEHYDSPDLEHWVAKQNRYTSLEAITAATSAPIADTPKLFGTPLQRRMWLKRYFTRFPFRYQLLFLYHYVVQGAWRSGTAGLAWARLRVVVMMLLEYKTVEISERGAHPRHWPEQSGAPDPRVPQFD